MLLRFSVKNFLSVAEKQELLFTASNLSDTGVELLTSPGFTKHQVLPAILVYGANASGKTTILSSLRHMATVVKNSHRNGDSNSKIPRTPFLLGASWPLLPTEFELDFVCNDIRYNYGFHFTDKKVTKEWLNSYPFGVSRKLFERENEQYTFGRELKGRNNVIKELTRENSLFVSAAAQNNHEQLSVISTFFDSLTISLSTELSPQLASISLGMNHKWEIESKVIEFLRSAGTGVANYRSVEENADEDSTKLSKKLGDALNSAFAVAFGPDFQIPELDIEKKTLEFAHLGENGSEYYLPLSTESSGTVRLLMAMPKIFSGLSLGTFVAIDELNLSLHTKAAELILSLFSNRRTNPLGAQLLATTHDTNLLGSKFLRRDQVWFVEKDREGKTNLYPLSDIATRKGDNIEKGYLQGRFGAIPFGLSSFGGM